jgi:Zn-finger nucleic acid-binding protein/uncharacterized membrane protein
MDPLQCPDCHVALERIEHESVQIHRCPSCSGVLVTHGDLKAAADDESAPRTDAERLDAALAASARVNEAGDADTRRCPVCDRAMRRYVYAYSSGVLVDGCDAHGLWLDAGELERIEAWSEAVRRNVPAQVAAQTARPRASAPAPQRVDPGPSRAGRAAAVAVGGLAGLARTDDLMEIGRSFLGSREVRQQTRAGSQLSIVEALARAEADQVPTEADGAVAHRAEAQLAVPTHVVWPLLARTESLPTWVSGLDAAITIDGRGSQRTDELDYSNGYRVHQRVTRLQPEQAIVWRDVGEWIRGVEVPPWNAGSWTELRLQRGEAGRCSVEMVVTQLPGDDEQLARITERAPALEAWVRDCVAQLAAVVAAGASS